MKLIIKLCIALVVLAIVAYFALRLIWCFQPKHEVNVFILDKTVTQASCPEHSSFIWILNNLRIVKPDKSAYKVKTDYMGFFPIDIEEEIFDFKTVRINQIETFAETNDMAYYTDCYGVLAFEWYKNFKPQKAPTSKVYGGLNQNDFLLLKKMNDLRKLVVGEYNMLGSPTNALIRNKVEKLFNIEWSGWTGKCFFNLDPNGADGPAEWMPKLYESQHLKPWPVDGQGIVLINNDGLIDVLLLGDDLNSPIPTISITDEQQNRYRLPKETSYTGWFEFVTEGSEALVPATYRLNITAEGANHLAKIGVLANFPAIVQARADEPTFYFAGDFADNPSGRVFSKIYGGKYVNQLFAGDGYQKSFFANFYYPLIKGLIVDYCPNMDK